MSVITCRLIVMGYVFDKLPFQTSVFSFMCMCVCMCGWVWACVQVSLQARRGYWTPWRWSYQWWWEPKYGPKQRQYMLLDQWVISPALWNDYDFIKSSAWLWEGRSVTLFPFTNLWKDKEGKLTRGVSVSALIAVWVSPTAYSWVCWWGDDKRLGEEIQGRGKGPRRTMAPA